MKSVFQLILNKSSNIITNKYYYYYNVWQRNNDWVFRKSLDISFLFNLESFQNFIIFNCFENFLRVNKICWYPSFQSKNLEWFMQLGSSMKLTHESSSIPIYSSSKQSIYTQNGREKAMSIKWWKLKRVIINNVEL